MEESYTPSFWEEDAQLAMVCEKLSAWGATRGVENCAQPFDVIIVGAGLIGVSTALALRERAENLRIAIVERGPHPLGASARNAGFACCGSVAELVMDLATHDADVVLSLIERRVRGLRALRTRFGDDTMRFEQLGSHELFFPDDAALYEACCEKLAWINREVGAILGEAAPYTVVDSARNAFGFSHVAHMIANRAEGQLDSGRLMRIALTRAAAENIAILCRCPITHIEETPDGALLHTTIGGTLRARTVIVATNGFAKTLLPTIDVVPARGQILVTAPIENLRIRGTFHFHQGYGYCRNVDDRVLLGGGRHLDIAGETTDALETSPIIQHYLHKNLREIFLPGREVAVTHTWSGVMAFGANGAKTPIMQFVSPHVMCAVRMGGMGVAIGSLVAEEAADCAMEAV